MKVMIAGDWRWPQYEKAFAGGLEALGHQVISFNTEEFFRGIFGKKQKSFPIPGPAFYRLNNVLTRQVKAQKPEIFLAWRCTHIMPATIKNINSLGIVTASYNNDDPFGPAAHSKVPWHHHFFWYWYLQDLKYCRNNFFYRQVNVNEAKVYGALYAEVLRSYFLPEQHHPVELTEDEKKQFGCDAVFVGHYEPDGREIFLRALVEAGLSVKLFGGDYWNQKVLGGLHPYFAPVLPAEGENYAKALCGAKICLAFLSKLNRDTYTRRCFEIPACGRVMLAERTEDLLSMFEEDKEACFFSSAEELVAKAKWLIKNPEISNQIARAGLRRVWNDGHDVKSRAAEFIAALRP